MDCPYTEWSASETGTYHVTCLWKRRFSRQSSIHSVCDALCVNIGRITLSGPVRQPVRHAPVHRLHHALTLRNLRLYAWWDVSKYCPPAPGLRTCFYVPPFRPASVLRPPCFRDPPMPSLSDRDPVPYFTLNYSIYNFEAKTIYEWPGDPFCYLMKCISRRRGPFLLYSTFPNFCIKPLFTLDW